jgi:hypothetical protein
MLSTTTGVLGEVARIVRVASIPDMPGRSVSMRTALTQFCFTGSTASSPVLAVDATANELRGELLTDGFARPTSDNEEDGRAAWDCLPATSA